MWGDDNPRLRGRSLEVSPSQAVVSFFIPVLCLYRPYEVVRNLYIASDPSTLRDPPQYRSTGQEALYRSNVREPIAPPDYDRWFPVRSWWALYLGGPLLPWVIGLTGSAYGHWLLVPVNGASAILAVHRSSVPSKPARRSAYAGSKPWTTGSPRRSEATYMY
jgi:hypothetical protein